jgi:uncharacterized membrane protein YvbJ
MMKSRFSAIRLVLALCALALFLVACGDVGSKIVKYSDKGTNTVNRLEQEQVISKDDADRIRPLISDVRAVGVEYDRIEQAIKQAKSTDEKASLREQLKASGQQVAASLRRLNEEGVLKIKNEATRQRVSRDLTIAEIIADLIT